MAILTKIILIAFSALLTIRFMVSVVKDEYLLMFLHIAEIFGFIYIVNIL